MLSKHNEPMVVTATPSPEPSRGDPLSLLPNQNAPVKASPSPAATVSATPTPTDQPAIPQIYGKPYGVARRLLIREGWLPNKRLAIHGQDAEVQSGNGPIFWHTMQVNTWASVALLVLIAPSFPFPVRRRCWKPRCILFPPTILLKR